MTKVTKSSLSQLSGEKALQGAGIGCGKTRENRENTRKSNNKARIQAAPLVGVTESEETSLSSVTVRIALQGAGIQLRKSRENTENTRKHVSETAHGEHVSAVCRPEIYRRLTLFWRKSQRNAKTREPPVS